MPAPQKNHELTTRFERNRRHSRAATDYQIDQLVYRLYGFIVEEIGVVEREPAE